MKKKYAPRPQFPFFVVIALLIIFLGLASCGDISEPLPINQTSQAVHTVCGGSNTVFGIDVSAYQGSIDWTSVKGAGVQFAIIRMGDGTDYIDGDFQSNWSNAKKAGLIRGTYQFFRPSEDATTQANNVIEQINKGGGLAADDLPPVIDAEAAEGVSASTFLSKIDTWVAAIKKAFNRTPIIYTGSYFWDASLAGSTKYNTYPLWIPNYTSNACPLLPNAWSSWKIWQYSDSGKIAGISGNVDLDRFNGTLSELKSFVASTSLSPTEPSHPVISLTMSVTSVANQSRDFCVTGSSKEILDLKTEQETTSYVLIKNTGTAIAANSTIGILINEPYLKVTKWNIETDWNNQGQFKINDMDSQQAIAHENPGAAFNLKIGAISPGETKRVVMPLRGNQFSVINDTQHATLRTYLAHVDDYYEKASYDAAPTVNKYQTQNSGDVKFNYRIDVYSAEICDGLDNDCDGAVDNNCVPPTTDAGSGLNDETGNDNSELSPKTGTEEGSAAESLAPDSSCSMSPDTNFSQLGFFLGMGLLLLSWRRHKKSLIKAGHPLSEQNTSK